MATENLKSTAITNLDAIPPVRATAGMGGADELLSVYGFVTPTNGVTTGSLYQMARVPSNAILKHVLVDFVGTITTFTSDITIYYSDLAIDETGQSQLNTGVVNSLSGASSLFVNAYAWGGGKTPTDIVDAQGNYGPANRNKPLWQAAGLSSDPGGFFDVVIVMNATASISGVTIGMEVQYQLPYA